MRPPLQQPTAAACSSIGTGGGRVPAPPCSAAWQLAAPSAPVLMVACSRVGLPCYSPLQAGFVWDAQGHIVTNYHVIRGASDVLVRGTGCLWVRPAWRKGLCGERPVW